MVIVGVIPYSMIFINPYGTWKRKGKITGHYEELLSRVTLKMEIGYLPELLMV